MLPIYRNFFFKYKGRVYYVDQVNGNDSNRGISDGEAWKTISKVNSFSFKPDDKILFKAGCTWAEKLVPPSAGKEGSYITFSSYGNGNKPVIQGSALNHSLEIASSSKNYLIFDGLDFNGATGASNYTCRVFSNNIIIRNCVVRNSANSSGLYCWSNDGLGLHNITVENTVCHDNYVQGIYIGSETGQYGPYNCEIKNCTVYNNGHDGDLQHGIYVKFGVVVSNTEAYSNSAAGIKTNCEGVYTSSWHPIVRNCYSHDNGSWGFYIGNCDTELYNNVATNNTYHGASADSDALRAKICFNTFVNNNVNGFKFSTGTTNTGIIFKNNLMVQDLTVKPGSLPMNMNYTNESALYNTIDYNSYFGPNVGSTVIDSKTFTAWKALSGSPDAHGNHSAMYPDFVSRYTDLHVATSGGNLSGKGVFMAEYDRDKDNKQRANPPCVGAYEY